MLEIKSDEEVCRVEEVEEEVEVYREEEEEVEVYREEEVYRGEVVVEEEQ